MTLSSMLSPYSTDTFFGHYFEKKYLYINRQNLNFYNSVLSQFEIGSFLEKQDLQFPSIRLFKNGTPIDTVKYILDGIYFGEQMSDDIIDNNKLFHEYKNGATVTIYSGDRRFQGVMDLCDELSVIFKSYMQANIYITPENSIAFKPHWDTHDVFVLQIYGSKVWELYGHEINLPTKRQHFNNRDLKVSSPEKIHLKGGDFLYVPRGLIHNPYTAEDESCHITIGIKSYTWLDLFFNMCGELENFEEFRGSIPFWNTELEKIVREKFKRLSERLVSLNSNSMVESMRNRYKAQQPAQLTENNPFLIRPGTTKN